MQHGNSRLLPGALAGLPQSSQGTPRPHGALLLSFLFQGWSSLRWRLLLPRRVYTHGGSWPDSNPALSWSESRQSLPARSLVHTPWREVGFSADTTTAKVPLRPARGSHRTQWPWPSLYPKCAYLGKKWNQGRCTTLQRSSLGPAPANVETPIALERNSVPSSGLLLQPLGPASPHSCPNRVVTATEFRRRPCLHLALLSPLQLRLHLPPCGG